MNAQNLSLNIMILIKTATCFEARQNLIKGHEKDAKDWFSQSPHRKGNLISFQVTDKPNWE